ncbi:MAG: phosphatase PAP2 family protein [Planctomycetota bacterium]
MSRGRSRVLAGLLWLALAAAAFPVDRWVYRNVAGPVAEKTGFKAWRFGRPEDGRALLLMEALLLLKRMGHFFFVLVISGTMVALARQRWRQVLLLWLCVAGAAAVGQGILKPTIAKLRPDGPLSAERAAEIIQAEGEDAVVRHAGEYRNTGRIEFRGLFGGYRGLSATTFPSGHSALAFATAAVVVACLGRGRYWFYLLAGGVAASRVLMGEHFLSDVIAGSFVGYASASVLLARPRLRRFARLDSVPGDAAGPTGPAS